MRNAPLVRLPLSLPVGASIGPKDTSHCHALPWCPLCPCAATTEGVKLISSCCKQLEFLDVSGCSKLTDKSLDHLR